jgi:YidC/Oxa1 family membrane protein insertase
MDRRTLVAFALLVAIFIGYPYYLQKVVFLGKTKTIPTVETLTNEEPLSGKTQSSPVVTAQGKVKEEEVILSNGKITVTISNCGAAIKSLFLNGYKDYNTMKPIDIYNTGDSESEKKYYGSVRVLSKEDKYLEGFETAYYEKIEQTNNSLTLISPEIEGLRVKKIFLLSKDNYVLNLDTEIENKTTKTRTVSIETSTGIYYEENKENKNYTAMINAVSKTFDKLTVTKFSKIKKEGFCFLGNVDWVCIEKQYFSSIFKPFYQTTSYRTIYVNNCNIMCYVLSDSDSIQPNSSIEKKAIIYAGPNQYTILKSFKYDFERILAKGFFGYINLFLLIVLNFFYGIVKNYGFSIVILSVAIKVVFTPLTHKSFQSMKKMQELQPQMKSLQEKYKDNPQQLNKEVMELYKKHKANPLGGCLPILIQMPIFIALYQTLGQSVELRGAPFIFWIKDLAAPDKMIVFQQNIPFIGNSFNLLPILMILSMIWQQKTAPTTMASKEQERMMLFMSIIFGFVFYKLPSGLVLYWFISNLLSIGHQLYIAKKTKTVS